MTNNDDLGRTIQDLLRIYKSAKSKLTLKSSAITNDLNALKDALKEANEAEIKNEEIIRDLRNALNNAAAELNRRSEGTKRSVEGKGAKRSIPTSTKKAASDATSNNQSNSFEDTRNAINERAAKDAQSTRRAKEIYEQQNAVADKAADDLVAANNKRVHDKLKSSLSGRPVETTADTAALDEAIRRSGSEGFNTYDSKSSMRIKENAEKRRIAAANKEQRKAESSEAHIATMSVKQMEWEEKLRLKRAADEEKDAQKRYVRQQTAAMEAIALREKEAAAVKAVAAKQADVEEKESLRRYMNQQNAAIKGIEARNKEAIANAKAIQKQTDAEVARDDRAERAWKKEQARRENAIIDRDQSNADAYIAELERRASASIQVMNAQATAAHRVGMGISVGFTYPLVELGKASIKARESMSKLEAGMTATMGSAKIAGDEIVRLEAVSKLPGLNFKDMAAGSLTLQNTGMTAAGAERTIRAFGNSLALAGKGSEELRGVELALQQIMSKGKLVGQELRQLQERLPMIREASKTAFGTADSEELTKRGIGAHEYILGITAALEQGAQVPDNFANAMKNLSQEMFFFQDSIGKALAPAITSTANGITRLSKSFRDLPAAAQTMSVQVAALAAGSGPLLLLTSQVLQIQSATAAWRREMEAAGKSASSLGQIVSQSVVGKIGIAALGVGVGILGGTLIAGDQTRNASGGLTDAQYKRSILAGGFTGLASGASTGFMIGNVPGAIIGGTVGAIGGMLFAKNAAQTINDEVPALRTGKTFADTGIDKNANEIRDAFSKNASKEWDAWYANETAMNTAKVRPNKYGHVAIKDQSQAEIKNANLKYAQDLQKLNEEKRDAQNSAYEAQKHYKDLYDKNAQLTANENRKLAWFNPIKAKADDPVYKQYLEDTKQQNARIEILKTAKEYADSQEIALATFDDVARKNLASTQRYAAITAAQDKIRVEEARVSKAERTASKDTALAAALHGKNDIAKQKIIALDTYNRTLNDLTELYENGEDVSKRMESAAASYQETMYAVGEAETELARQEGKAKTRAADIMNFIGEENELVTQELDARRSYWETMDDLAKEYKKGTNVEGRYALAAATYQKQHSDIMKADIIDKRTRAVAEQVNNFEMYALQQEMGMIGSDTLKDTDPLSGADDYNKYWAGRARIESSYAQRNLTIQNTPVSKRIPNAQAASDAQYQADRIALDRAWVKSDKDRTDKSTNNILSRIKANREEADRYTEDQARMMQAARDREKESMEILGSSSQLWEKGAILGAQQRLNGPLPSSTLWNRGQQPEFWEIVQALKDITDEAKRLADATEYAKQMGAPTRPVPYYEQRVAS